jgi:hypothetical protein
MTYEKEQPGDGGVDPRDEPYSGCFARSCTQRVNNRCMIYTAASPPVISIDGMCVGFEG